MIKGEIDRLLFGLLSLPHSTVYCAQMASHLNIPGLNDDYYFAKIILFFFFLQFGMSGFSGSAGSQATPFSTSLAVVVLINGESYSWGAGHLMDGGMLAAKSRMVVVTLNYRLGILGIFLFFFLTVDSWIHYKINNRIPSDGRQSHSWPDPRQK